jgi:hypothetical protein
MKIRMAVCVTLVCVGPNVAFAGKSSPQRTQPTSIVDVLFRPLINPHPTRRAPAARAPVVHAPMPRPRPFDPRAETVAANSEPDDRKQVAPSALATEPERQPEAVPAPYLPVAAGP